MNWIKKTKNGDHNHQRPWKSLIFWFYNDLKRQETEATTTSDLEQMNFSDFTMYYKDKKRRPQPPATLKKLTFLILQWIKKTKNGGHNHQRPWKSWFFWFYNELKRQKTEATTTGDLEKVDFSDFTMNFGHTSGDLGSFWTYQCRPWLTPGKQGGTPTHL